MSEFILEMKGVRKEFPGLVANDNVNLQVKKGEIHALLGENGAGKSTLMNILYGLYQADAGQILYKGQQVEVSSPRKAIEMGIGMVHQHFMLIPALTVAENMILGMQEGKNPLLNLKEAEKRIRELGKKFGLVVDPTAVVWQLSVGEQQRVEILKALYRGAEILILDEPTAVLTPQETDELFAILRSLTQQGLTIIFISHKLNEVKAISDRVTILQRGRVVKTVNTKDTDQQELARMMVGREVLLKAEKAPAKPGDKVLEVKDLEVKNDKNISAVKGVSFEIKAGEIFGLAGVDGNGQSELIEALTGLRQAVSGQVYYAGENVTNKPPRYLIEKGMAHIPEDRHLRGIILNMSIKENMIMETFYQEPFSKHHILQQHVIADFSNSLIEEYDIRTTSNELPVGNLSGGNQQKVVLARMLQRSPNLLILVHPTRGLDVGASEYIHKRIIAERDKGCAVLLVSTELDEILSLSDRIGVIYEGVMMGIIRQEEADVNEIGLMMAGAKRL
nr:ABC transporter ATP-binding protein [Zhaonella formicivorans]